MTTFQLGRIEIEKLKNTSILLSGLNVHKQHQSRRKINDGFGTIRGENVQVHDNRSALIDRDVFDMPRK